MATRVTVIGMYIVEYYINAVEKKSIRENTYEQASHYPQVQGLLPAEIRERQMVPERQDRQSLSSSRG